jgi:Ser/Thr protein kinase RdoA (MazF antagonist)
MYKLLDEQPYRVQALAELGGPETLLHGDLWISNIFVLPTPNGLQARLIDWDRVGVGPVSYDLSTFLLRFPAHHRLWILDLYRESVGAVGWRLPSARDLNLLFDTAECARFANYVIWPAIALLKDRAEWGFDELAAVEQWFETLEPVLSL